MNDAAVEPHVLAPAAEAKQSEHFRFTATGGEYFRLWAVNACLTLLTLGIYSPWAKVRKARYFARNTRIFGDAFDFSANPWAVLRGRVIALGLLGFYTFAFQFSVTAGLLATGLLVALGPWLFASAASFRLRNTRWRGIAFRFDASLGSTYRSVGIVIVVWVSGTVASALLAGHAGWILTASAAALLPLPGMHHRLKAFQHGHARFANHAFAFQRCLGAFYGIYLLFVAIVFAVVFVTLLSVGFAATRLQKGMDPHAIQWVGTAAQTAFLYNSAWPSFASRIQVLVWRQTTLGPLRFQSHMTFKRLTALALRNAFFLLLTAGFYWPFAVVAWARYRVESMRVECDEPFDALRVAVQDADRRGFAGEGAMDAFGLDIGW